MRGEAPSPSGGRGKTWLALGFLIVALVGTGSFAGLFQEKSLRAYPSRPLEPEFEPEPVMRAPPPIDDEYFPCDDCHEGEPADPEVRELDEHDEFDLAHGDLWCLDCHQSDQRDLLHLSDASPVEMSESWRLCTRCHAKKIPDWRGRCARKTHRLLVGTQGVPDLRPLPRSSFTALRADRAKAAADTGARHPTENAHASGGGVQ